MRVVTLSAGAFVAVLGLGLMLLYVLPSPSNDREWRADHARLSGVGVLSTSTISVASLRDWHFASPDFPKIEDRIYSQAAFDVRSVKDVYFGVEPFGSSTVAAHTFLIFTFTDSTAVAVSIEARREVGEASSIITGLLPLYELIYVWSTPRDILSNIVTRLNADVYLYRVSISDEVASALLMQLAKESADLEQTPRMYNLLTTNCTNSLARAANVVAPEAVPLSLAWFLTGKADAYVHELGYLEQDGEPFFKVRESARATSRIASALLASTTPYMLDVIESTSE